MEEKAKAADEEIDATKHAMRVWTFQDVRRSVATHLRDGDVMDLIKSTDWSSCTWVGYFEKLRTATSLIVRIGLISQFSLKLKLKACASSKEG